ncbi:MAG: hypothetical protein ABUT20_18400 [Bacteroidota bacterium]
MCAGMVFLLACNNEKKESKEPAAPVKKEESKANSKAENIVSFNVNNRAILSYGLNISLFDFGNKVGTSLNLISGTPEQTNTINLNINGYKPGKYRLEYSVKSTYTPGVAYGTYTLDNSTDQANKFTFTSGQFTVVSIDTTVGLLNASFYGTAKNTKGDSVIIRDGNVINGKMNPGVNKFK